MQLKIRHTLSEELALPLSYHHIIQSIIYRGLADESGYSRHMHNSGYAANNVNNVGRCYKLFNFSLLRGNSRVMNRQIILCRMGDQKPGYLHDASSGKLV